MANAPKKKSGVAAAVASVGNAMANVFSPPGDDLAHNEAFIKSAAALSNEYAPSSLVLDRMTITPIDNANESDIISFIEAEPKVDKVSEFTIVKGMAPPPVAKRGALKVEKFPFSKLEVGDGFYIEPTKDKPTPWKSFASTVNAAQRRFSKVKGTKERKNKKSGVVKTVNELVYERKFRLYKTELDGREVAAVQRTE